MKLNKIFLVSIFLLAIVMLGAVSAADDTKDLETSIDNQIVGDSIDDVGLTSQQDVSIVGDDDSESEDISSHEAKNTTISINTGRIAIDDNETWLVDIKAPADSKYEVTVSVGSGEIFNSEKDKFTKIIDDQDLKYKHYQLTAPSLFDDIPDYQLSVYIMDGNDEINSLIEYVDLYYRYEVNLDNIRIPGAVRAGPVMDDEEGYQHGVYLFFEDDASGNFTILVDDVERFSDEISNYYFYDGVFDLTDLNLTYGTHKINIKYGGDKEYYPFNIEKEFIYYYFRAYVSDNVTLGADDYIYVYFSTDAEGNLTVYIDDEHNYTYDVHSMLYDEEMDEYTSRIVIPLEDLDFGTYDLKITYSGENYPSATLSGTFNINDYLLEIFDWDYYRYDREYYYDMESIYFEVRVPSDAKEDVYLIINGIPQDPISVENGWGSFEFSEYVLGDNTINLTYGDEKYFKKTVNYTLPISARIKMIDGWTDIDYLDENNNITITLPSDAKGNLSVYKHGYDDEGFSVFDLIKTESLTDGYASISISDIALGEYDLIGRYEGSDYSVDEEYADCVAILPNVEYLSKIYVNTTQKINVTASDDTVGDYNITLWNCEYDEDDYELGDLITVLYDGSVDSRVSFDLPDGLEVGLYVVKVKYNSSDYEQTKNYLVEVTDISPSWEMYATYRKDESEYIFSVQNIPREADGIITLYIDDKFSGERILEDYYDDFYKFLEPGIHSWEITFTNDSYYEDSKYSGSVIVFDISVVNRETLDIVENATDALVRIYCFSNISGEFVVKYWYDDSFERSQYIKHIINENDYGKNLTWKLNEFNITSYGLYGIDVFYFEDPENEFYRDDNAFIGWGDIRIFDNREFRAELIYERSISIFLDEDVIGIYCPDGSFEKIVNITVMDNNKAIVKSFSHAVKKDEEKNYFNLTLNDLGISAPGEYIINITVDGKEISNEAKEFEVRDPIEISDCAYVNELENEYEIIANVKVPIGLNGWIAIAMDDKLCFNSSLKDIDNYNYIDWGPFEHQFEYWVYNSQLNETFDIGIHNVTVFCNVEGIFYNQSGQIELVKPDGASNGTASIEIYNTPKDVYDDWNKFIIIKSDDDLIVQVLLNGTKVIDTNLYDRDVISFDYDYWAYCIYAYKLDPLPETYDMTVILYDDVEDEVILNVSSMVSFYGEKDEDVEFNFAEQISLDNSSQELIFISGYLTNESTIVISVDGVEYLNCTLNELKYVENEKEIGYSLVLSNLTSSLTPGKHKLTINYLGKYEFHDEASEMIFARTTPDLAIKPINDGLADEPILIEVTAKESFNGDVTVKVGDANVTVTLNNGYGNNTVLLPAKTNYKATINFTENDGFFAQEAESNAFDVDKANSEIKITVGSNYTVGDSFTIVITNNTAVNVTINDKPYAVKADGTVDVDTTALDADTYKVVASNAETSMYKANSTSKEFTIVKKQNEVTITVDSKYTVGDNFTIAVTAKTAVNVTINDEPYAVKADGTVDVDTSKLKAGEYTVVASAVSDGKYLSANETAKFTISKLASKIEFTSVNRDCVIQAKLSDITGEIIANANVTYTINGVKNSTKSNENGIITINATDNSVIEIIYAGDDSLLSVNGSLTLKNINPTRKDTSIIAQDYDTKAIDYYAGERGGYFEVTLTDGSKPIANKAVKIGFNGKVYNTTTDDKGLARLQINLAKAGTYTFAVAFLGDDDYKGAFVVQKITVTKKTTSISASAKSYKASAKTKSYTVTLKTEKGSSIDGKTYLRDGKTVKLTVNGKTYTAKTNAKGQATFKLDISKKGTYTANINFAGDDSYLASKASAKITIN